SQYTKNSIYPDSATPISDFQNIDQNVTGATLAREEMFMVDGKSVPVYVIMVKRSRWPASAPPDPDFVAYRVDEQNFRVYKAITYAKDFTRIALYSIRKWNQDVDPSLFTVEPTQSIRPVSSLKLKSPDATDIIGLEAPDFTLPDIA